MATAQQPTVRTDHMRHHKHYQDSEQGGSPYAGGSSFMERVSEAVASGMGTVSFLVVSSVIILAWVGAKKGDCSVQLAAGKSIVQLLPGRAPRTGSWPSPGA